MSVSEDLIRVTSGGARGVGWGTYLTSGNESVSSHCDRLSDNRCIGCTKGVTTLTCYQRSGASLALFPATSYPDHLGYNL